MKTITKRVVSVQSWKNDKSEVKGTRSFHFLHITLYVHGRLSF